MRLWGFFGALCAVALCALMAVVLWPAPAPLIAWGPLPLTLDEAAIERGRYMAIAGDCVACHTAPAGRPFAGGLAIASPFGPIYSSNITPDRQTGIGSYTLDEFERALRRGIARDGSSLYPAMPYPSFARLSIADVKDLYGYLMHGVEPVAQQNQAVGIPWPLSMRWPLALWRKAFAPADLDKNSEQGRYASAQIARGAYLVEGAGHCGACHTPRAVTLQERALDDSSALFLAGGSLIDGWVAVNLRGNTAEGLGNWTAADIVSALRGARTVSNAVVGRPMSDVVVHSTQYLAIEDLRAIAAYLKTLPPTKNEASSFVADPATAHDLATGRDAGRGAELYVDNCAACHRTDGRGSRNAIPTIAGNSSVLADNPSSIIRLILAGGALPSTTTAPSPLGMPGFAWRLSNAELAALATFVRSSWGNHAPAVDSTQVELVRSAIARENQPAGR